VDPRPEEIRAQLERMVASEGFANADRMSGFLRYVVERALAGESDRVKEYVIGVEVFGRDERYDPRLDSIVRVEARRLRTKLDEYYAREGADDEVIIKMRRGSYAPYFERRSGATEAAGQPGQTTPSRAQWRPGFAALAVLLVTIPAVFAGWRAGLLTSVGRTAPVVTIAVLPFTQYSTDTANELLAARLTDGVTAELARIRTVHVTSRTSAQQFANVRRPLREIAKALNADVVIEGSVLTEGGRVRVSTRLVDPMSDRKFWVKDFAAPLSELDELQRRIATTVAKAAEQPRGSRQNN
jgi:TolB-like protein